MIAALYISGAAFWMVSSFLAFSRAADLRRDRQDGWASDAFWFGLAGVLLALNLAISGGEALAQ